jgi:predicted nucleotidyltransferase
MLRVLQDHGVDYIIVGGVSAILQGAPLTTFDLDIVHSRTPENLDRLLAALLALDAYYRGQGTRRLAPKVSFLASPGHQLLMTNAGILDVLGTVGGVGRERGYEDLLPHTHTVEVMEGLRLRILDLAEVIALKEEAGRDKDRFALPVLRRTLEERNKGTGDA